MANDPMARFLRQKEFDQATADAEAAYKAQVSKTDRLRALRLARDAEERERTTITAPRKRKATEANLKPKARRAWVQS